MSLLVKAAVDLAFRAHAGVKRKYGDADYVQHPMRVALMVASGNESHLITETRYGLNEVIAAAILHDVLEDTEVPESEIEAISPGTLSLVKELTNPSHLPENKSKPRHVRKQIDRDHLKEVSLWAKIIKLCDRIDNLRDMTNSPVSFKKLYAGESRLLLEALRGNECTVPLEEELEKAIQAIEASCEGA